MEQVLAGAAVGTLLIVTIIAIALGRYDALGFGAFGAWLLVGLP